VDHTDAIIDTRVQKMVSHTVAHSVAYAENFHGGFWFRVIWWSLYLVCAVCDVTI